MLTLFEFLGHLGRSVPIGGANLEDQVSPLSGTGSTKVKIKYFRYNIFKTFDNCPPNSLHPEDKTSVAPAGYFRKAKKKSLALIINMKSVKFIKKKSNKKIIQSSK